MDQLLNISDDLLIEAYNRAIEMKLKQDFIKQLKDEMERQVL